MVKTRNRFRRSRYAALLLLATHFAFAEGEGVPSVTAPLNAGATGDAAAAPQTGDIAEHPLPALTPAEEQQADALVESARQSSTATQKTPPIKDTNAIRVNYVPESIRQEIRDQVRADLRADVVQDVFTQAKNELWGMPQALPGWVNHFSMKGDFRLRAQDDIYATDNNQDQYVDLMAINSKGGFAKTTFPYLNTTEDRERLRLRARVTADAKISPELKAQVRLSTGSNGDPVSTNQTLGNYGNRYGAMWDLAYLKYDGLDADRYPWLTMWGGRMPNPFMSTDLVWDTDLAFEGLAAKFRFNLRGSESLLEMSERDRTAFVTIGAFPLQEVERSSRDKWLYGAQTGAEFIFLDQSALKIGLAYYYFRNTTGVYNTVSEAKDYDFTAPSYMQKGNLVYNIRNSTDVDAELWALAADYHELNFTVTYDETAFSPVHIWLTADVVKNIGYDVDDIERRTRSAEVERAGGWSDKIGPLKARTLGYQLTIRVGWPLVTEPRNWQALLSYRDLQRDAVMDAFTDSDFHLGGTDAKGWLFGFDYGIHENTWIGLKYITSDSIDGLLLGIDTVQLDLNAKF